MPSFRAVRLACAAGAALCLAAAPAQAQLGKLKKLGADAAKEAAKDKLGGKKDEETKPATGGAAAKAAAGTGRKESYTITSDRIALVVASLKPYVAEAQQRQANARIIAEYNAGQAAANACMERWQKNPNIAAMQAAAQKNQAQIARNDKQADAMQTRLNAAMTANNLREWAFLDDSLTVLRLRTAVLTFGAACKHDFAPASLIEARVAERSGAASGDDADDATRGRALTPTPDAQKSMSREEFGRLRERLALWVLQQETPTLAVGKEGVFTADELAALQAHAGDLKALAPLLKDNSLRWSSWADLSRW